LTVERERAVQNDTVRLYQYFTSAGILADPYSVSSPIIRNSVSSGVVALHPVHVRAGVYYTDWTVPEDQEPGSYEDEWPYVATSGGGTILQTGEIEVHDEDWDFVVGEVSEIPTALAGHVASLELLLGQFGDVAVYDEPARLDPTRKKATTTYQNWRYDRPVSVRTGATAVTDFYADYRLGKVILNAAVADGVPILVRYHFTYFTTSRLLELLRQAVDEFNMRAPLTHYTLENLPAAFKHYVVLRAFVEALDILRLDKLLWTTRLIFANPAEAESVMAAKTAEMKAMIDAWRKPRSVIPIGAVTSTKFRFRPWTTAHRLSSSLWGL